MTLALLAMLATFCRPQVIFSSSFPSAARLFLFPESTGPRALDGVVSGLSMVVVHVKGYPPRTKVLTWEGSLDAWP